MLLAANEVVISGQEIDNTVIVGQNRFMKVLLSCIRVKLIGVSIFFIHHFDQQRDRINVVFRQYPIILRIVLPV